MSFPFTVDEVLEQIEDARKEIIRIYKSQAKEFEQYAIGYGHVSTTSASAVSLYSMQIVILNDAYIRFDDLSNESDPDTFDETLEEVLEEISNWDNPHSVQQRLAFNELRKNRKLPFFRYL